MKIDIRDSVEKQRGCGYRKPGGLYLVTSLGGVGCGKLPIEIKPCPSCGTTIKQSRGIQIITEEENHFQFEMIRDAECLTDGLAATGRTSCLTCGPFRMGVDKYGLMWVGEKFYPTTKDFRDEAALMGVSKRISAIPREFKVGQDYMCLAHPKAITPEFISIKDESTGRVIHKKVWEPMDGNQYNTAGIFMIILPTAVEYVVTGKETKKKLKELQDRGVSLVNVIPDKPNNGTQLNFDDDE